jgi:circadian clock protein KaiC
MTEARLNSGQPALDEILGGGLPANGITIVMGLPGAGKTILAQQYAFHNATPDHPVLFFSTMSEPLDKIVRFGQDLDFFDGSAIGTSVYYEDLGRALGQEGLPGAAQQIAARLKERRPGLVVIDGFRVLRGFADGDAEYRRFLYQLAGRLSAFPAASLWLGVYQASDVPALPEFAVADAILDMAVTRTGQRDMRFLEVRKLRGSGFRSGQHAYRLGRQGLQVFPRLADPPAGDGSPADAARVPFGVPGLDEMLAGGLFPGAATVIAGPAGAGKTVLGLHFIFGGVARGEPGIIATFQENPPQLRRMFQTFGWPAHEHRAELMYRSPIDVYVDEWVYDLLAIVERTGARRVLLDSLADLEVAAPDAARFREFVYSMTQRLSRRGTSLVMTCETRGHPGTLALSQLAVSNLADVVIALDRYTSAGSLSRAVSVPKSRGSEHDQAIREFSISAGGITIGAAVPGGPA